MRIKAIVITILCLLASSSDAQKGLNGGFGRQGSEGKGGVTTAPYKGPGDIISGATAWASCARTYNAAFGVAAICDLVDTATGAATCTLKSGTNGFADLTSLVCVGNTLSVTTFCTVTHAAGCSVTKAYDQTGNGNHFTNATLSQMPTLTLNAINSLPGMTFVPATSQTLAAGVVNYSQPYSVTGVYERTGSFTTIGTILGATSNNGVFGSAVTANTAELTTDGTNIINLSAADSAFHSANGTVNGASSGLNIDGTDSGNAATGSNTLNGTFRYGRGTACCTLPGVIMEAGIYTATAISAVQRGNLSTNQHSSSGYNF